jgi:chromosome segregation ATPase
MTLAFKLSEQVNDAPDDRTRFRLIVDAIQELEEGWPRPGEIARGADVRESELRLQKEIEVVRKEIEVVRKEIEVVRGEIKESELRLHKEIEAVRKEIEVVRSEMKESELRLQKEIEVVRSEMKETELRLQKEIGQVRVDLEQVRVDLKSTEANLRTAMHRQTVWIIGAIGAVTGLVRLLDWLLA